MGWSFTDMDAIADDITEWYLWIKEILNIVKDEQKEIAKANKKGQQN